jgi:hypothetical protein
VEFADRHSDVIERGQRVAMLGLDAGRVFAIIDSVQRLPLSRAITRHRRSASSAPAESRSRVARRHDVSHSDRSEAHRGLTHTAEMLDGTYQKSGVEVNPTDRGRMTAARARARRGGRSPRLSRIIGVPRSTVYGYLETTITQPVETA